MTKTGNVTGQIDGVRTEFSAPFEFLVSTLEVHRNGSRLEPGIEFEEIDTTSFRTLIDTPQIGDKLLLQAAVAGARETCSR